MRSARSLTVSHSIPCFLGWDADPLPPSMQTPHPPGYRPPPQDADPLLLPNACWEANPPSQCMLGSQPLSPTEY